MDVEPGGGGSLHTGGRKREREGGESAGSSYTRLAEILTRRRLEAFHLVRKRRGKKRRGKGRTRAMTRWQQQGEREERKIQHPRERVLDSSLPSIMNKNTSLRKR